MFIFHIAIQTILRDFFSFLQNIVNLSSMNFESLSLSNPSRKKSICICIRWYEPTIIPIQTLIDNYCNFLMEQRSTILNVIYFTFMIYFNVIFKYLFTNIKNPGNRQMLWFLHECVLKYKLNLPNQKTVLGPCLIRILSIKKRMRIIHCSVATYFNICFLEIVCFWISNSSNKWQRSSSYNK